MGCTSVVIADRHPVVLQGMIKTLRAEGGFEVVASCSDGRSCIEAIRNLLPDIAILDISMPGLTGLEILTIANSESLSTRLVFFTASIEDRELVMSAAAGAYGIIPKDVAPEILVQALRQVADGQRLLPLPGSGRIRAKERRHGDCPDGAHRPRATDHASGVRRVVEQRNWAPAEYYRRHYQTAPPSHLSEARNQQPNSARGARHIANDMTGTCRFVCQACGPRGADIRPDWGLGTIARQSASG